MSRLPYFPALIAVSALSFGAASAQSPVEKPRDNARVEQVAARDGAGAVEVEIRTSGPAIAPDAHAIAGPDRIVIDFPGAVPAASLHGLAMKVNSGALKGIRAGLFVNTPPTTRVVLDLTEPQSYRISTAANGIVVKLGPVGQALPVADKGAGTSQPRSAMGVAPAPRLQNVSLDADSRVAISRVSQALLDMTPQPLPPKPAVTVTFADGMLTIHSDKASLAQVLYEVQIQTQAEIAIPAGAEAEQVIADLGPAPAREVLAALLNGSTYNFIFVGDELNLERVILTRRDPNIF